MELSFWMWLSQLGGRSKVFLLKEEGDLSTYLAQGILALAAVSLSGVVLLAFGDVGGKIQAIVTSWTSTTVP